MPETRAPAVNLVVVTVGGWLNLGRDDQAIVFAKLANARGLMPGDNAVSIIDGHG